MRCTGFVLAFCAVVGLAHAADVPVVGKQILVKDPKPGLDPTKRKVVEQVRSPLPLVGFVGNPAANGAELSIFLHGATSTNQVFSLGTGVDPQKRQTILERKAGEVPLQGQGGYERARKVGSDPVLYC